MPPRLTVDAMSWSENTCPSLWQSIRWFAPLFPLGILPPWSPRPRPALLMCLDSGNAWRKSREKIHGWRVNCRMLRFVCLWWLIKGWTGMDSRDVVCCDCYLSQNTCISSDRSRNAQDSKRIQALNLYRHWLSLLQPQLKLVRTLDAVLEAYTSYTAWSLWNTLSLGTSASCSPPFSWLLREGTDQRSQNAMLWVALTPGTLQGKCDPWEIVVDVC